MNMKLQAWTRGLLLSSFALTGTNVSAVVIGGIDFADNAFADRVLSTDFTGDIEDLCGATPVTLDDAVTGLSFDTFATYGTHDMFAGADGDYNSDAPPNQYLEIGFVDNVIVNEPGNDLVLFEQGARNAFRVALDKFSILNPYAPGALSVATIPRPAPEQVTGYCIAPTFAYVDLSDLGVPEGGTVYRVFVSSPLLENGDIAWNNPVYPAWGVPEFIGLAAINSADKPNYAPEVDVGDGVIVSLPDGLVLTEADIDVIDDSTPNASLTYTWEQTAGTAATLSTTNTLATTITFPAAGNYSFELAVSDGSLTSTDTLTVQVTEADGEAPTTPGNFAAEVLSDTGVSLTWTASTDNVAVKQYNIYRDDVLLTSTSNLFYKDFRVEPGSDHSYFVRAEDPAGNESVATATLERTLSARLFGRRTAASADDAEEHQNGVVVINDGDLELVREDENNPGTQIVGLRFQNVTIPPDATIVKAWLDFMADEISTEDTSLTIRGIDEASPAAFAATNQNISVRPTTTAAVAWDDIPAWTVVGETYRAPDMAAVVQELVDAGGWASGQPMAFVLRGTGRRVAETYDAGNRLGPRLFIEYQDPEPVNQPPVVAAGADQSIVLPTNSVSLEGSVTDDNLTGVLNLTWSMTSGPDTVIFSAPSATATEATFSTAGTYVLRLTANDNEFSPFDELTVIVSPQPNLAPVVNVGVDRAVSRQNPLALTASVTDDGISGQPVTVAWTQDSGPGAAIFDPNDDESTSVTFPVSGSYVLRLTVDDGLFDASDTLTVTVSEPDEIDPSTPANLLANEVAIGTVRLTWNAATDNIGVVGYNVYRDDELLAQVSATEYLDTGLTSGTEYTYEVAALDAAENESDPRASDSVITRVVPDDIEPLSFALARSDGAEQAQNGTMTLGTWPIDLGSLNAAVGLRFNSLAIPSGALISRAYLRFCPRYSDSGTTSLNIAALNEANAEVFGTATNHLSGRATMGNVPWNIVEPWTQDQCVNSPDITLLVQEIVRKDEWRFGNSIGFKITGTGARRVYYGGTSNAPQLIIEHFDGNQAPVVNAGDAASVRMPHSVILSGSATDDGDGELTYQWSPASGVTFADATSPTTTATFTGTGTYTLRLTASDGERSSSDDVVITVLPANQAPAVSAGSDQNVVRPNTLALTGTATDADRGPSAMSYQWSMESTSGSGGVIFSAAQSLSTNVTFSANGTYVLRLTADDGAAQPYDELTVTVTSPTNQAPVVNVGSDRTISLPNTLSVTATVTDDGYSDQPVTLLWVQDSATNSGVATIASPNAVTTNVTFSVAGTYVLRLTADDGPLDHSDTLTVTVRAPDLDAPTVPQNVRLLRSDTKVGIRWNASTDNVGVTAYRVYRDGVQVTQTAATTFVDTGRTANVTYGYQVSAVDEAGNESALSDVQNISISGASETVITSTVALLQNDGAEQAQNGTVTVGGFPIDLGSLNAAVGLRFNNLAIPPGAIISRAYLSFCAREPDSGTTSLTIAALYDSEDASPDAFTTAANSVSARATIGAVNWNVPDWADEACGEPQRSPDISLLAQLLVNSAQWNAGDSMGFKITGTGSRRAYRGASDFPPQLVIEYFGGDPIVNVAPVVNVGADRSVILPATLSLSVTVTDAYVPSVEGLTGGLSMFSGPAAVSSRISAENTWEVRFTTAGTYILRVTVSDGELEGYDEVTVTVTDSSGSSSNESGGGGGGGSLDLWSLLALMLAGGIRFGSVRAGRRRLSGGCSH